LTGWLTKLSSSVTALQHSNLKWRRSARK